MEAYFPLFVNITDKKILVVGAGTIAARRAEVLADFGAEVLVVAPDGAEKMRKLEQAGRVKWQHRPFEESDLDGVWLTITATDNETVNNHAAEMCRIRKIPVNHAGDKTQCDFYFSGVAREDGVVIGVTASGTDHRLARRVTDGAKKWLRGFLEECSEEND